MLDLQIEQSPFTPEPTAVSSQLAIRAHHSVTGNDDREGVGAVRRSYCSNRLGSTHCASHVPVRCGTAIGDIEQRAPDLLLKLRAAGANGCLKDPERADEVRVQLRPDGFGDFVGPWDEYRSQPMANPFDLVGQRSPIDELQ